MVKLNSRENTEDGFAAMSKGEIEILLERFACRKNDASSIIEDTAKIKRRDAMRHEEIILLVASASIATSVLICISTIYFPEPDRRKSRIFKAMVGQMENSAIDEVTLITSRTIVNLDENAFTDKYTKRRKGGC